MKRCLVAVWILGLATMPARGHQAPKEPANETLRAKLDPALLPYRPSASVSGNIRTAGHQKLMKLWIQGFSKVQPEVQFSLSSNDEGLGRSAILESETDIVLMSREISARENAGFEHKYGYKPFVVTVAGGSYRTGGMTHAIAVLVNRENPIDKISLDQLDAIFSKTRKGGYKDGITTWGQLGIGGDWLNRPITLYGLKPPSGIVSFIQQRVLRGGEFNDWIMEYKPPALDAIAAAVAQDLGAIGYASLADVNAKVKALALAEKAGGPYYEVTFENVVSHRYPLSRLVYIVLNRPPGKPLEPRIREFLSFVLSREGQEAAQKEGVFLPLTPEILNRERSKLD